MKPREILAAIQRSQTTAFAGLAAILIRWESPIDVKASYASVDRIGQCYVFNVCHNRYRLIARITFAYQENDGTVFVKHVLTHKDYDRDSWKKDCQ